MKKLKAVTTALLLIGLVSLGGCSGNSAEVLPSPEPTTTMKVIETPSPTPTAVVEPTQAPIPTPTATVEPSATVEPTNAPVDEVKPSEKPVEATTSTKTQPVEQSKAPATVDTSNFVYPENSTTEGLRPQDVAKGWYVDKTDNAILDQDGGFHGYSGPIEVVHPDLSGETDKALYGGETGTDMLDTSGAYQSEPTPSAADESFGGSLDDLANWGSDNPGPDDFIENATKDFDPLG